MSETSAGRADAQALLRRALGEPSADFREGQWEAIDALVNQRRRLLLVQRTGWGKSAVYFIATRILRDRGAGPTLIVSPLLALMRNQIEAAERLGIRAPTINSTNTAEWPAIVDSIRTGGADAILISPERLANDDFVESVLMPVAGTIGLLVVDEAHCISDWGHDFRPDYRRITNVLRNMPPNVPVLGTTATANNRVLDDICAQIGDVRVQRGPLTRDSLALQTLRLPDQSARLAWLAEHIGELPGTGIVYTLTKRDAEQVAEWLRSNGVEARAYYSDVWAPGFADSNAYRTHLERQLLNNEVKALVATTALGMGYDKPDLGFVVHYQAPGSVVAYYQQVGRAGRAIDRAVGVLMAGSEDEDIHEYFRTSAFPHEEQVQAILTALAESDGLAEREIESAVNLPLSQIRKVLGLLSVDSPSPVFREHPRWYRTAVPYEMDRGRIEWLSRQRELEWREVQAYVDTTECKMAFLRRALDDEHGELCGKCSSCLGGPVVLPGYSQARAIGAAGYLRHAEMPLTCRVQVAPDAFPRYGFRGNLPAALRAEEGRILSRWGDAGWGGVVRDGKHAGRFGEELADALVEMIRERWRPEQAPLWVTSVPSLTHPELVPDLARRVARRLGLPFVEAVRKVRANEPQKLQQNRYHQCANLDGVFEIAPDVPEGPVLLIDDVVDSTWTMTVVAALLRRAGSGLVWPVALASSSAGD